MKKTFSVFCFLFSAFCLHSQVNLVPNPSFENITTCFSGGGVSSGYAPPWDSPSDGSPDIFDSCGSTIPINGYGFQFARTGNVYVGGAFFGSRSEDREYLQVQLTAPLIAGHKYYASFYTTPAKRGNYNINGEEIAINNIGLYFNTVHTYIPNTLRLNYIPQINETAIISDTANWTLVSGNYIAQGGEQYIIIGNFYPNSQMDSLVINNNIDHMGYYYIDDVSVIDSTGLGVDEINNPYHISLSPNPNDGEMQLNYSLLDNEDGILSIYNVLGENVNNFKLKKGETILNIKDTELKSGLYFYKIIVNDKLVKSDKVIINK